LSTWALLIARALARRGIDAGELFRNAHIQPERLRNPNARYPLEGMQRLWMLALTATQDPCFGLEVGRLWHPTTFYALGYAALAASSLRDALEYLVRYCRVITTGARMELIGGADAEVTLRLRTRFAIHPQYAPALAAAVQAGIAAIVTLCREAAAQPVHPQSVLLKQPEHLKQSELLQQSELLKQSARERLEAFFNCPVVFGAHSDAVVYRALDLDATLPTGNPQLEHANEQVLVRYLSRLEEVELSTRVQSELVRLLPSGEVKETAVARSLHMSLRSMQRKLKHERTSFRTLLEETRSRLAQHYFNESTLAVSEISHLLGFAETSSLSRAKKRWQRAAR
jgi:AraC-like DNA-binding protein